MTDIIYHVSMFNIDRPIVIAVSNHFNGGGMMLKSHSLYCIVLDYDSKSQRLVFLTLIGSLIVFELFVSLLRNVCVYYVLIN
jgi:hypothetical protein